MKEKYLTLAQNTCAARIFLNTFGLILENTNNINEFSIIKIFDKNMNIVGKLYFDNGKVMIYANYNNSILEANYDISKVFGSIDIERDTTLLSLSAQWSSKIKFKVKNSNNIKLCGEFLIVCSIDSKNGIYCLCLPLIKYNDSKNRKITLSMLRNGITFNLIISSESHYETITISPCNNSNGFIRHIISDSKNNEEKHMHEYRKDTGIFACMSAKDKLLVISSETEGINKIDYIKKIGDDSSEELVIQKGKLMQDLDPDMFEKIKTLRKELSIGDVSLLDNLISICYDSYTDEELEALLGIKRKKMNYQDGANSLKESYFGIGQNSQFLSIEQQKRLLKTNKKNG